MGSGRDYPRWRFGPHGRVGRVFPILVLWQSARGWLWRPRREEPAMTDRDLDLWRTSPSARSIELGTKLVLAEEIIEFALRVRSAAHASRRSRRQGEHPWRAGRSGWHTCCMFMRLLCDRPFCSIPRRRARPASTMCCWKKAVSPATLSPAPAPSPGGAWKICKRPTIGLVTLPPANVRNQHGEVVLELENTAMFLKRGAVCLMAMTLDEFFRIGQTVELGSHLFDAASDQGLRRQVRSTALPYGTRRTNAKNSVFGRLQRLRHHALDVDEVHTCTRQTDTVPHPSLARRRPGA